MEERLLNVFGACGVFVHEDEKDTLLELDSIQYVSILVMIEEEFELIIPEEYMAEFELSSFNEFLRMVCEVQKTLS